jgi:pyridoxine 5-phosphate synthase
MVRLGVNIDHVATVRQARRTNEPDPVWAAAAAELAGADQITCHLREDRRHIQDRDLRLLRQTVTVPLNMELALNEEVLGIAVEVKPDHACLVPERREEVTTEGGLDVAGQVARCREVVKRLHGAGISVSLFIGPDAVQVRASKDVGADAVELHTGRYADAHGPTAQQRELEVLLEAGQLAVDLGLQLHAGHGLTYRNVIPVARIPRLEELNIGHSIISRAVLVGLDRAVREMKALIEKA